MLKQKLTLLAKDRNKRNFFIYGVGQAFNLLSPLVISPFIVAVCKEAGLAKVGLGFALSLFLILIVDYAFEIKGTKSVSENRDDVAELQKLLNVTIASKLFLFFISLVIALGLLFFIPFFNQEKALFFFSLTIVFAQVFNPVWFLQGIEDFRLISFINITSKCLYVLLVIGFVQQENDYVLVNFFLGLSSFVLNLFGLIFVIRKFRFVVGFPKFTTISDILKKDFTFCISQLFLSARQLSPLVLVSYFLGLTAGGHYRIMEQIITLFRTYIQVFLRFFYARVCYKFKIDRYEGRKFWKKYTSFNFGVVIVLLSAIYVFSAEILHFFHLSPETVIALNPVFRFSLIVSLLMSLSLPLEQLMFVRNKSQIYVRITIFATVINIGLILLLIKPLELYGILISLITAELFFILLYFYNSYPQTQQLDKG